MCESKEAFEHSLLSTGSYQSHIQIPAAAVMWENILFFTDIIIKNKCTRYVAESLAILNLESC